MKTILSGLLFLLFAVNIASSQIAASQKEKEVVPDKQSAELERISRDWMDAMVHHDKAKLESLMAPEYVLRNWDNSNQFMARAKWLDVLFNHLKIDKWEQKMITAHVYGNVGVVTSKYTWAGSIDGKAFDSKGYISDVFSRSPNGWQVVSRTSGGIPGSKLIDGTLAVW